MSREARATGVLREEHRLILQVVAAFEDSLAAAGAGRLEAIGRCITFFHLFADACHHGKEEDLLFAALEEHEPDASAGGIALMREEHAYGRTLVARMRRAHDRAVRGDAAAARDLAGAGADYIDFIRDHIRKEDDGLFDLADDVLRGSACTALCDSYETACRGRFGGHTLEELHDLAAVIVTASSPDAAS